MATDLIIGIGAEYTGKAAFAQANKSVTGLEKSVSKLGKQFLGLFTAQKLLAYSKSAVIAYKDDALAAKTLTQTLNNLGLAFEDTRVKTLIANLESTYKVLDDKLRPAFQSLLQVTGSVSMSQKMLETALNASAATGTDLETVTQDLAQAYVGNLRGLRKYNLGLTQAELTSKSFAQIQEVMNKQFTSQAMIKAADPIVALSVAANNAKETIGKGLVDAIDKLVGAEGDINKVTAAIDRMAKATAGGMRFLGDLSKVIADNIANSIGGKAIRWLAGLGESPSNQMPKGSYTKGGGKALDTASAARAKAEADAIKRNKELLALAQKQAVAAQAAAKAKKEAAILEKAQQLFNMDLIENVAALQGKITADEKLRLETQQALLTGNAQAAGSLAMKLLEAQQAAMLARQADPFGSWSIGADSALKSIQALIEALKLLGIEQQMMTYRLSGAAAFAAKVAAVPDYAQYASPWQFGGASADPVYATKNMQTGEVTINLQVQDNTSGGATVTQNNSLSGTPVTISRYNLIDH